MSEVSLELFPSYISYAVSISRLSYFIVFYRSFWRMRHKKAVINSVRRFPLNALAVGTLKKINDCKGIVCYNRSKCGRQERENLPALSAFTTVDQKELDK